MEQNKTQNNNEEDKSFINILNEGYVEVDGEGSLSTKIKEGIERAKLNLFDEAISDFDDALKHDSDSKVVYRNRGICTAYGFLDHSLKEDCAIMTISLKGVSNGETKKIHP